MAVDLTVRIACEGADKLELSQLTEFQGDLKSLSIDNHERLKREIIDRGFSFPFFVWRNKDKNYLLDGHQRFKTLKAMQSSEGYKIPPIPVVYVEAKNKKEAKQKLLSVASQYGKIETQGLYEFASEAEMTLDELKDNFSFPDVDFAKFEAEFFGNGEASDDDKDEPKDVKFVLTVTFENDNDQQDLFTELRDRGFKVKA